MRVVGRDKVEFVGVCGADGVQVVYGGAVEVDVADFEGFGDGDGGLGLLG